MIYHVIVDFEANLDWNLTKQLFGFIFISVQLLQSDIHFF